MPAIGDVTVETGPVEQAPLVTWFRLSCPHGADYGGGLAGADHRPTRDEVVGFAIEWMHKSFDMDAVECWCWERLLVRLSVRYAVVVSPFSQN